MKVADAHSDMLSLHIKEGVPIEKCKTRPENLAAGGVALQTFALFTCRARPHDRPYQDGKAMLECFRRLPIPILDGKLPEELPDEPTGVLSCEGGEMLEGSIDRLAEFDDDIRLRMIALTWNFENEIGFSCNGGSDKGLKPFGRTLIGEMDRRGILTDVSHLNDAGFWEVCERSVLPPIASHSNCRWLCSVPRNLTKEMVRALVERKGFIGINFYACFLQKEGNVCLDHVVRHIEEMLELGAEDILGFGSDFDGIERWPEGMADPSDYPGLLGVLRDRGYDQALLEKISGGNLWRVLKQADDARRV